MWLRKLIEWLKRLLRKTPRLKPPEITLEAIDMANVRARVTWPTEREGGRPVPLSEIDGVKIELGVVDQNEFYRTIVEIEADTEPFVEHVQTELDAGQWFFRFTVSDKLGTPPTVVVQAITVGGGQLSKLKAPGIALTEE